MQSLTPQTPPPPVRPSSASIDATELIRRVNTARAELERAASAEALARGLRDALDVGVVASRAADRGGGLGWELCQALERLLRAVAKSHPPLAAQERAAIVEGAPEAGLYAALGARAFIAQRKIVGALEALYRGLIDAREES